MHDINFNIVESDSCVANTSSSRGVKMKRTYASTKNVRVIKVSASLLLPQKNTAPELDSSAFAFTVSYLSFNGAMPVPCFL